MITLTAKQIRNNECSIKADRYKKELRANRTPAEKHLYNLLQNFRRKNKIKYLYNPRFKFQKAFWKGEAFVIMDFFFAATQSCIEVDGGYHYTPSGIAKDKWRDAYIMSRGVRIFHVRNETVIKWDLDQLTTFLKDNNIMGLGCKRERQSKAIYI